MFKMALSDDEIAVIQAVESGEIMDFGDRMPVIRAFVLQRILLRLPMQLPTDTSARVVGLTPLGVRLRGARVSDELNLSDTTGPDGGALPPLVLENCVFCSKISLQRALIRHVSFAGSRLNHLQGDGVIVGGSLDLSHLGSAEENAAETGSADQGICWVELRGARVEGELRAAGATLVVLQKRDQAGSEGEMNRYALDLREARINGSLLLWPRFRARGGVSLQTAYIGGDVRGPGAKLTATDGEALMCQGATIQGGLILRPSDLADGALRFTAAGRISLKGARIAGSLHMEGASVQSVVLENSQIGGDVQLDAVKVRGVTLRFQTAGTISLEGANIAGKLNMRGALVNKIAATNVQIGGSALLQRGMNEPFVATGEVRLLLAKVGGELDLFGATFEEGLVADNAEIGGNLRCGQDSKDNFIVRRRLRLRGTKIAGRLIVRDLRPLGTAQFPIVDLTHAKTSVLEDQGGAGWGEGVVLKLEGFEYGRIATDRAEIVQKKVIWNWTAANVRRLVMFWYSNAKLRHPRLKWLDLEYPPDTRRQPNRDDYSPDAYDRLIRVFRTSGAYEDARKITQEQQRIERRLYRPWLLRLPSYLFGVFFDYGLSPVRALGTFALCVVILWRLVYFADHKRPPVLVVATNTVNSVAWFDAADPDNSSPAMAVGTAIGSTTRDLPCGDQISSLLYALDVFVPAIELHQESKCDITSRPGGRLWFWGRGFFAILGWIVTPLTVLTISGVLRRHLEK